MGVTLSECSVFRCLASVAHLASKTSDTAECVEFTWWALSCSINKHSCSICAQNSFNFGNRPQVCHAWLSPMFDLSLLHKDRRAVCLSVLFLSKTDATNHVYELLPTCETTIKELSVRHTQGLLLISIVYSNIISRHFRICKKNWSKNFYVWWRCFQSKIPSGKIIFNVPWPLAYASAGALPAIIWVDVSKRFITSTTSRCSGREHALLRRVDSRERRSNRAQQALYLSLRADFH